MAIPTPYGHTVVLQYIDLHVDTVIMFEINVTALRPDYI